MNKKIVNLTHPEFEVDKDELQDLRHLSSQLESNLIQSLDSANRKVAFGMNWEDIQSNLGDDEAAVELINFNHYDRELSDSVIYGAFILRSTGQPEYISMPDYRLLENRQFKYWSKFIQYGMLDDKSYDLYWKDIDKYLEGVNKVNVSSNGVYHVVA